MLYIFNKSIIRPVIKFNILFFRWGMGFIFLFFALFFSPSVVFAQTVPDTITYEGVLLDDSGDPITSAHTVRMSFWTSVDLQASDIDGVGAINTGAANYGGWYEFQTVTPDVNGVFTLQMGSVIAFPSSIDFENVRYLQIEVKTSGAADTTYEVFDVDSADDAVDRQTIGATLFSKSSQNAKSPVIIDNTTNAFTITEGASNFYLNINTTDGSESLTFGNNTTNPDFIFDGSGNLGVGTSSPGSKLDVVGVGNFRGLTTSGDVLVDADGSVTAGVGTANTIVQSDALVVVELADNLCTDSLTNPTVVLVLSGATTACDTTDGVVVDLIGSSAVATAYAVVDSTWAFQDSNTNDLYDDGEDLYIDAILNQAYDQGGLTIINSAAGFETVLGVAGQTADRQINLPDANGILALQSEIFDIDGLATETTIDNTDTIAVYDSSAGGVVKMSRSDFLSGLVAGAVSYAGVWNAATNTPVLSDGTGVQGQYYSVSVAGVQDLGSGNLDFTLGDWVIHNGSVWEKVDTTNDVTTVFGRTGAISATAGDYTGAQVINVAAGNISATDMQAAINELDTEKLGIGLSSANILVGNGSNIATEVSVSGDISLDNTGTTIIQSDSVGLGADTTGNYAATIIGGTGISSTGSTTGEGIDHTLSLDIDSLSTETNIDGADTIAIYDDSAGAVVKVSRANFLGALTGAVVYQGTWDGSVNTPTLSDGTGSQGEYYIVSTAGTQDLGTGNIEFTLGDWVIHDGTNWDKVDAVNDVQSVFGRTGVVTATLGDYTGSQVTNVAAGNISATDTQGAINELDAEKLGTALNSANIFVGNGANVATGVSVSGDVSIDNTGATTIQANSVSLGTDTVGNFLQSLIDAGSGIFNILNGNTEGGAATIGINANTLDFSELTNSLTLDADTSITATGSQALTIGNNVSLGTVGTGAITATDVAEDSVGLGADTTGNYTSTITGGVGIASTGATTGEGIDHTLSLDIDGLAAESSIDSIDTIALYDDSAGAVRKVSRADFLGALTGAVIYQGTWDASSNSPTLADGTGSQGQYYIVSVAGTQDLGNGNIDFTLGDWIIHDGVSWDKVDAVNDVQSVFGRTGVIAATTGDYTGSQVTNVAAGNIAATDVQGAIDELDDEKLDGGLASANVFVGNGSGAATGVAISGDIAIDNAGATTIQADSVGLGTDTTGNYVQSIADNGNGTISVTNGATEGGAATIGVAANSLNFDDLAGILELDATVIQASSATSLAIGNNATLETTGTGAIIATSVEADSVGLGADTSGDYTATVTGGTGISSTGATTGEGVAHTLSLDIDGLSTGASFDADDTIAIYDDSAGAVVKVSRGDLLGATESVRVDTGVSTLVADGTNNSVNVFFEVESGTDPHQFFRTTSSQSTLQDLNTVYKVRLPDNFVDFSASNDISFFYRNSGANTGDSRLDIYVEDADGDFAFQTADGLELFNTNWTEFTDEFDLVDFDPAAGDYIYITVKSYASTDGTAQEAFAGELILTYTTQ